VSVTVQEVRYVVEVAAPTTVLVAETAFDVGLDGQSVIVIQEPTVKTVQVQTPAVTVVTQPAVETVEIGIAGPQGPPGTIKSGPEASRPPTGDYEGDMYVATDTDRFYLWFS